MRTLVEQSKAKLADLITSMAKYLCDNSSPRECSIPLCEHEAWTSDDLTDDFDKFLPAVYDLFNVEHKLLRSHCGWDEFDRHATEHGNLSSGLIRREPGDKHAPTDAEYIANFRQFAIDFKHHSETADVEMMKSCANLDAYRPHCSPQMNE